MNSGDIWNAISKTGTAMNRRDGRVYETGMVAILCLAVGIMAFEQVGVNFLVPFIKPGLRLDNAQVGELISAYWVVFAVSSFGTSVLADSVGRRRAMLAITLGLLSLTSMLSGLSRTFTELLGARALMGLLEGPVLPLAQSIIALQSAPCRQGTNMGIVGNLGSNILSMFVAPLVLVAIAEMHGWRTGFFVVSIPALICCVLVATCIRETEAPGPAKDSGGHARFGLNRFVTLLRLRNIALCAVICCCFVAYLNLGFAFLPLYYVSIRHLSSSQMSALMSVLGVSAALFGVVLPALSDRVGRRPVLIIATLLSISCPVVAMYYPGPTVGLAILVFIGWAFSGTGSIFMGTIPSETVAPGSVSTAMGMIVALGTLGGGLVGPPLAGWSADHWGLKVALIFEAACAALAALASVWLRETVGDRVREYARTG